VRAVRNDSGYFLARIFLIAVPAIRMKNEFKAWFPPRDGLF
jgi:hypothetical protein